jgi:dienelactone hydrolase
VRRTLAALLAGLVLAAGVVAGWGTWQGSRAGLAARKGRLVVAEVTPAGRDPVSTRWDVTLLSSSGLRVRALLRVPRGDGPHAATVLVGGINRGRRVAIVDGLDAIARHAIVVAPDYPIVQSRRAWRGTALLRTAMRLRPAAFDTIAGILLLLDYLESRGDVAPERLFLVGSSLGAPAVTIAGGVDPRPAAVVALYGGGAIARLASHVMEHSERDARPRWQAWLMGHALAGLVAPLAPERYAAGIAPRPFLMLNGATDTLVPRASVQALYDAARSPKQLVWVASDHVQPDEAALIRDLSARIVAWLVARGLLPAPAADAPPPRG